MLIVDEMSSSGCMDRGPRCFFLSFYYLVDRHGGDYIRSFSIDLDLFQSFAASLG